MSAGKNLSHPPTLSIEPHTNLSSSESFRIIARNERYDPYQPISKESLLDMTKPVRKMRRGSSGRKAATPGQAKCPHQSSSRVRSVPLHAHEVDHA